MIGKYFIVLALLVSLAIPGAAKASSKQDIFYSKDLLHLNASSTGDILAAVKALKVSSVVTGDIVFFAGSAVVESPVQGSIRGAVGSLELRSFVGRNVSVASKTLRLNPESEISGSLLAAASDAVMRGKIGGDVRLFTESADISGVYEGDVEIFAKSLHVADGTVIRGTLTLHVSDDVFIADGATIGKIIDEGSSFQHKNFLGTGRGKNSLNLLASFSFLLTFFLAWSLFRPISQTAWPERRRGFFRKMFAGVAACIVGPMICILAAVTVVGLPVAVLGFVFLIGLFFVAVGFGYLLIGNFLLESVGYRTKEGSFPWIEGLAGLLVMVFVSQTGWPGSLVAMIVWLWSTGSLVTILWDRTKKAPEEPSVQQPAA